MYSSILLNTLSKITGVLEYYKLNVIQANWEVNSTAANLE